MEMFSSDSVVLLQYSRRIQSVGVEAWSSSVRSGYQVLENDGWILNLRCCMEGSVFCRT